MGDKMKLNVKAFALTAAIIWGLALFLTTWWVILFQGATGDKTLIAYVYRGYSISALGSIIGLAWGFMDGLICGAVFAWLYNALSRGSRSS